MKSKATLFLMEQLVMVLVFALAAALCLGFFVRASQISGDALWQDGAVAVARNMAEVLKATGDPAQALAVETDLACTREILLTGGDVPGLQTGLVRVSDGEGREFSLTVAWQEVLP